MKVKKKGLTPMDKLTQGYEKFIKGKEVKKENYSAYQNIHPSQAIIVYKILGSIMDK